MKAYKKIFTALMAVMLLTQCLCGIVVFAQDEEAQALYEKEYSIVEQLGYFSAIEEFMPDDPVSGKNFVAIFNEMTGMNASVLYTGVEYVAQVKFAEILKVFVTDLGYDSIAQMNGGYPTGYVNQALQLDLTKKMKVEAGDFVTYRTLAKLIYNAMEIKMMRLSGTDGLQNEYEEANTTYMEKRLGLEQVKGIITSLSPVANESHSEITINNKRYTVKTEADLAGFVGCYVEAYSLIEEGHIVAVAHDDKYEIITVNAEDVVSYSDYTLSYYDGDRIEKEYFFGADVYKNGALYPAYSEEDFKFPMGSISFVYDKSEDCQSVIIAKYDDFVVSGLVTDKYTLYAETSVEDEEKELVLDPNSRKYICIYDTEGNKLSYADIVSGDVLSVAKSDGVIKVIRCNERITGFKITTIDTNDGITIYSGEQSYKLADSYLNFIGDTYPEVSDEVTIYLNSFGEAAYLAIGEREEYEIAYLLKPVYDPVGAEPTLWLKLLLSNNKIESYKCADKVLIEMQDGTSTRYTDMSRAFDDIASYKGVLSVRFNDDNEINSILMPLTPPEKEEDRLNNRLYTYTKVTGVGYRFAAPTAALSYRLFYQLGTTVTFSKPTDEDDHDQYIAYKTNIMQSETSYGSNMTAYTYGKNTRNARVIVLSNQSTTYTTNHDFFVITKITQAVTDDGEDVKIVSGRTVGGNVSYTIADNGYAIDHMSNIFNNKTDIKAEVGDIIRVLEDKRTGLGIRAQILYDCSEVNPETGSIGFISGAKATYSSTGSNNNPFQVYRVGQSAYSGAIEPTSSGSDRYIYGYVLEKDGNYLYITTQDLSKNEYNPSLEWRGTENPTGYVTEIHPYGNYSGMTISYNAREISASGKSIDSIRDYKHSGSDCSRVIVRISGASPRWIMTLNND